ncbi:MAG: dienelactone hydrolase family protein [Vicinamibacterales bacterium]
MKHTILAFAFVTLATPAMAQQPSAALRLPRAAVEGHEHHGQPAQAAGAAGQQPPAQPQAVTPPDKMDESRPPGTDAFVKIALETSPRHHEWVDIKMNDGTIVKSFVVFPESKDRTGVVIVIHENRGLNDWARSVADQLAEDGFIAIAPDLLSGKGPGGGNTDSIPPDQATRAIGQLTNDEVNKRLDAVREYAIQMPPGNGRVGMVGFCWGGGKVFQYAAHRPGLNAGVVYYGSAPAPALLERIVTPILGLFGEQDARVNTTINAALPILNKDREILKAHMFRGAGHGFLRQQFGREANLKASEDAWPLTIRFLREHLK